MPKLAGLTFSKMSKQNLINYYKRHCIKTNQSKEPKFRMTFCMLICIFLLVKSKLNDKLSDNSETTCESSVICETCANLYNFMQRKNKHKLHSSYHILLIILSNDVQLNPGPKQLNNCRICSDKFSTDVELVKCQTCQQLYHLKCVMPKDINTSFEWICISRHCKPNHQSPPTLPCRIQGGGGVINFGDFSDPPPPPPYSDFEKFRIFFLKLKRPYLFNQSTFIHNFSTKLLNSTSSTKQIGYLS